MKITSTAPIFTATLCLVLLNTIMAPIATADDLSSTAGVNQNATTNDFQLIVPDVTNCSIPDTAPYASAALPVPTATGSMAPGDTAVPGLESFDLSASRNYNMPSQTPPPSNDLLPSQNTDSASTPNVNGQMPSVQPAPQAAFSNPAPGATQPNSTETQSAQEWRRAAFESLTSNPNVQPMFGRTQSQNASASANANATGAADNSANKGNTANGAPLNNGSAGQMDMTAPNPPTNMGMNPSIAQSQTLTGASSNQQYGQTAKRGNGSPGGGTASSGVMGVSRFASMFTMMGSGLMMGSMMRR